MNIIEKFQVKLTPDSAQAIYQDMKEVSVKIDLLTFTDGSIRVNLPEMVSSQHRYCEMKAFIENGDDLIILGQIKDVINRLCSVSLFSLHIISPVYSRYDRVMLESRTDAFGAKVFSSMVDALGFDVVSYYDNHSEVLTSLTNHGVSYHQSNLVNDVIGDVSEYHNIVAPDKGALKKLSNPNVICDKVRDVTNGQIVGLTITETKNVDLSLPFLIVDDLCEGGRTFMEVSKCLHREFGADINAQLYVTHGIFSNNAIPKLLSSFSMIYVYFMKKSVYDSLHDLDKTKIKVKNLINL